MTTESPSLEVVIKPRTCAEAEGTLRYFVPSNHTLNKKHLVDLASYSGNGECSCAHFQMRLQPLLRRKIQPREAFEQGLVKRKPGQQIYDILRCDHIMTARSQFLDDVIVAIIEREKLTKHE